MENFIFDFDGVLVDSVDIKTNAFKALFMEYGDDVVRKVVKFHLQNGGVSRLEKIKYIYSNIIMKTLTTPVFESKCAEFKRLVVDKVVNSNEIKGAFDFFSKHTEGFKFIVTGTPQDEILEILTRKKWTSYFDEILGSPITKKEHVAYLLRKYNLKAEKFLFFGDATTDYEAAFPYKIPFLGICNSDSELVKKYPKVNFLNSFLNININNYREVYHGLT